MVRRRLVFGVLLVFLVLAGIVFLVTSPDMVHAPDEDRPPDWQPINDGLPGYTFVTAIVVLPSGDESGRRLLAAAYDPVGMYRSEDSGQTWQPSNNGLNGAAVFVLATTPKDPTTVYAGTTTGVFRSSDGGISWVNLAATHGAVYSILIDPDRPQVLHAGTINGLLSTTDGGASWNRSTTGRDGVAVLSLAQGESGMLCAGTNGGGIMCSRDAISWATMAASDTIVSTVIVDPFDRQTMLARARTRLLRSQDGGQTWRHMPDVDGVLLGLLYSSTEPAVVYAQTARRGVLISRDQGTTWQATGSGLDERAVYALTMPARGPYTLLAGTTHGIYGLQGDSWTRLGRMPGAPIVRALALSPHGELFAGTTDGVFRRQGTIWQRTGSGLTDVHVLSLAFAPPDKDSGSSMTTRILAGTFGRGIQVSEDDGASWSQVTSNQFTNMIAPVVLVDDREPQYIYSRVEYARIIGSADGGQTWQEHPLPITVTVFAIAVAPGDRRCIYAGTDRGVYRSLDRGQHWQAMGGPAELSSILALAVDAHNADHVYAGGMPGLYRSLDGGQTWARAIGLDDATITTLVIAPGGRQLYAGSRYHGVFVSDDGGVQWRRLRMGLDEASVNSLVVDPASGALYAGTEAGVFLLTDPSIAGRRVVSGDSPAQMTQTPPLPTPSVTLAMHTLRADGTLAGLIRQAGFDAIVQVIAWREVEIERGEYFWEYPDAVLRAGEFYGLASVLRVDFPPVWLSKTQANAPPEDPEDYGTFVYKLARRYRGRVKGYIIWNEPNLAHEWGGQKPDPVAYAGLLKIAYRRIKEADPQALVVSAGLAPTNENNDAAMDDREFLRALYLAGAKDYFDVLATHPYGFGRPPDDPPGAHDGLNFARLLDLRAIMEANGDAAKPVWITEFGWTTETGNQPTVSVEQQAAYLVQAHEKVLHEWPWVQMIAVWNLSVGLKPGDEMRGYSLIADDYRPKPAYIALSEMTRRLGRSSALPARSADRVIEILAPDVEVHMGDQDYLVWPWFHVYRRFVPSTEWTGEFYVPANLPEGLDPPEGSWVLSMDGLQFNEWGNAIEINGQPLAPPFLPGRVNDWAGYWTRIRFRVPAGVLRPGLNRLTIRVGMNAPVHQAVGVSWEDLQFRNIRLEWK